MSPSMTVTTAPPKREAKEQGSERLAEALLPALKEWTELWTKGTEARKGKHQYCPEPAEGISPAGTLILACCMTLFLGVRH